MINTTKKLSKAQLDLLGKMFDGFKLKFTQGIDGNWSLINPPALRVRYERVNGNTAFSLLQRGLIVIVKQSFPTSDYKLTETAIALMKRRRVRMQLDEISNALKTQIKEALALPGSDAGAGNNGQ